MATMGQAMGWFADSMRLRDVLQVSEFRSKSLCQAPREEKPPTTAWKKERVSRFCPVLA